FFFFQAEDGIRDKLVTGVQTCALPISRPRPSAAAEKAVEIRPQRVRQIPQAAEGRGREVLVPTALAFAGRHGGPGLLRFAGLERSEERRVGKECRGRWAAR